MKYFLIAAFTAVVLFSGAAQATDVSTVWTELNESAPRSIFDEIRDSAPRSVFDQLNETARLEAAGDSADTDRLVGE
ncbi:MAG: hypothetical protein AB7L90_13615 [Hyphomicrobiaceae bacterium]